MPITKSLVRFEMHDLLGGGQIPIIIRCVSRIEHAHYQTGSAIAIIVIAKSFAVTIAVTP